MNDSFQTGERAAAPRYRTLIIESQRLFGKALVEMLTGESSIDVIGDFEQISEDLVRTHRPDLIVIDTDGVGADAAYAIAMSRSVRAQVKICALSSRGEFAVNREGGDRGADAYLVKDLAPREFARAVRMIAQGKSERRPAMRRSLSSGSGTR